MEEGGRGFRLGGKVHLKSVRALSAAQGRPCLFSGADLDLSAMAGPSTLLFPMLPHCCFHSAWLSCSGASEQNPAFAASAPLQLHDALLCSGPSLVHSPACAGPLLSAGAAPREHGG